MRICMAGGGKLGTAPDMEHESVCKDAPEIELRCLQRMPEGGEKQWNSEGGDEGSLGE